MDEQIARAFATLSKRNGLNKKHVACTVQRIFNWNLTLLR